MKRVSTVYLFEIAWAIPSIAILVGMLVTLIFTAYAAGIHLPSDAGRVDPIKLSTTAPFDGLQVVQVGPRAYEVHLTGQTWSFTPNEIHVPAGSTVSFVATSRDVVHGLFIPRTTVNAMLLPGQVTRAVAHFERPGDYPIICHEYCGILHHMMAGKVIVRP